MERETPQAAPPSTFLCGEEASSDSSSSARARFERLIRRVQAEVCAALEAVEEGSGGGVFREDAWTRPGGGGGISRVLQGGRVFEKAAVNVSVVYGVMPPEAYRAARPDAAADAEKAGPVPFFAAGVSSVIHPNNPFAPTLHFNYRYFETEAPQDAPGAPRQWWFGGGTDLTPSYIIEEDIKHFHAVQKQACDKFDPTFYPRFKKWCDDYFHIKHRGERRGVGGIFFDDLSDHDQPTLLDFVTECAESVIPAYVPIIERRKDTPFTEDHRTWQQLRRGRYVEFNLVYDRGTTFGLKTGGRIESILVSLPLTARWEYDHKWTMTKSPLQVAAPIKSGQAVWTTSMTNKMLGLLCDMVASGRRTSSGFKKVHFNEVATALNEHFKLAITGDQVSNHLKKWRKIWGRIVHLKNLSGALWDEDNCIIRLSDEHYAGHCKDHKSDVNYLNTPIEYYHAMNTMFGTTTATGKHARSGNDPLSIDIDEEDNSEVNVSPNVGESSSSKAPAKKKAKVVQHEDDALVTTLKDGFKLVAEALAKSGGDDDAIPDNLWDVLVAIKGFDEEHIAHYYAYLVENPKTAKAFMTLKLENKLVWLIRYAEKTFGVVYNLN